MQGIPGCMEALQQGNEVCRGQQWATCVPEEAFDWPAGSGAMLAVLPVRVIWESVWSSGTGALGAPAEARGLRQESKVSSHSCLQTSFGGCLALVLMCQGKCSCRRVLNSAKLAQGILQFSLHG